MASLSLLVTFESLISELFSNIPAELLYIRYFPIGGVSSMLKFSSVLLEGQTQICHWFCNNYIYTTDIALRAPASFVTDGVVSCEYLNTCQNDQVKLHMGSFKACLFINEFFEKQFWTRLFLFSLSLQIVVDFYQN